MLGVSNIWAGGQNRPCKDSSPAHLYYTKVSDRKTIKRQKFLEMCLFFWGLSVFAEKVKRLMCKLLDDLRRCSSAPVASVCFWPVLCYLRGWLSASGA